MKTFIVIFAYTVCFSRADSDGLFDDELYRSVLDEELCLRQLQMMETSEFYEASFRVPRGLFTGNPVNFGNFHQCLAIKQHLPGGNVEGKYCMIHAKMTSPIAKIPSLGGSSESDNITWTEWNLKSINTSGLKPSSVRLAVCVPRACRADALLRPYAAHPRLRFNYSVQFYRLPGDKPFHGADYTAFVIFTLLGLLTIASTAYEINFIYILKKDPSSASEVLRACSLYHNAGRLLAPAHAPRALACLDGVRALSVLWIMLFHTTYALLLQSINRSDVSPMKPKHMLIWVGQIAVDTFFVLSGLLLIYSTTRKNKQFTLRELPLFYLNRYIRLFPVLATTVLLQASVLHRLVDAPHEYYQVSQVKDCRNYWWSALLHVQNIVNLNNKCLSHSWYLSVNTQLYVVSPLVLCWVLRAPRAAWRALAAALLTSVAATLALCFYYNYPHAASLALQPNVYYNTVTRSPPFFIGMLLGYALHIYRDKKLRIPKWCVLLCYGSAVVLSSVAIFIQYPGLDVLWQNQIAVNFKYAFYRSCWALALCWLIFACANGYGGPVNWFLSLKMWRLVARLSYAMYMISCTIQFMPQGAGVKYYFDMQSLLWRFAGDVLCAVLLSVATCVVVEEPVATLYKLALRHAQKPTTKTIALPYSQ